MSEELDRPRGTATVYLGVWSVDEGFLGFTFAAASPMRCRVFTPICCRPARKDPLLPRSLPLLLLAVMAPLTPLSSATAITLTFEAPAYPVDSLVFSAGGELVAQSSAAKLLRFEDGPGVRIGLIDAPTRRGELLDKALAE